MRRSRSHRDRGAAPSRDRWVIPYADFMTLLFAFFTALYAVASVDASRLPVLADGLREAIGGPPPARVPIAADGVLPNRRALVGPAAADEPDVRAVIERELRADLVAGRLEVIEDRRGLVLAIPEALSFATGRADLSEDAQALMSRVAAVLARFPNAVRVEGHTDNTPIHTVRFTSNFELSTARATQVIAFFIAAGGIPAGRLSAAGYSEYHARAANDTPEGRARNRRVDIVILNLATEASEEPTPAGDRP